MKDAINVVAKENFEDGRVISLKVEINGHTITILDTYAPNNSGHIEHFNNHLNTYIDNEYSHILCGDFICTRAIKLIVIHKIITEIKVINSLMMLCDKIE